MEQVTLEQLLDDEWIDELIEETYKTRDTERLLHVLDKVRYLLSHRRELVVKGEDSHSIDTELYSHKRLLVRCLYKVTAWEYLID